MAQDPVVINFSDANATGATVTIDVTADNFTNISGMQLFIGWDEAVLSFQQIININGQLDGFNTSSFATPPAIPDGHVNVSWFSTNALGESENLPDGARLFSILLSVVGQPCDETDFELVDYNGQPNEAYDGDFNEVSVLFGTGTVLIPGEDCGGNGGGDEFGLGLIGEEVVGPNGSNVCVAITVDSFVNINSAQFAVQYDQTILEYTGYNDGPLNDELVNPTGANNIRFLWLVPATEGPNTLADGTTLIEFCFNVIGDLGDCSPINIISITTPPALDIEFINGQGQVVDYYTQSGEVCVGEAQVPDVNFVASDEVGEKGSRVCVDVTTENFEDVGSFQWAFTWNDNVMVYDGLGNINNINISDNDINQVSGGKLRVSWLPTTAVTRPDGSILFQLCFDLNGDCDATTTTQFVDDGANFQIEVGDGDGNSLPYAVQGGTVSIECACELDYTKTDVSCNGFEDGKIYITLTGCEAQSFLWSSGQTSQNLEGVGAGSYRVTVTDTNGGQIVSDLITLSEPSAIVVSETITNVSCTQEGRIQLNVQGGTPGYDFNWSPNVSTNNIASGLAAGTYAVTITDQNNCEINKTYGVTSNLTPLAVEGSMTDITCKDANDGSITINASDGCPGYNIAWSDGQSAGQFTRMGLAAGTYTATVTDQKGQTDMISFTITNPAAALQITGTVNDAIIGGASGSIDITVTGGEPNYTYAWSNGATTQDVTVGAGTYTVFVEDDRGCTTNQTFEVIERYGNITLTAEAADLYNGYGVSCYGECDGKINISVVGNPWTLFVDGVETSLNQFPQLNFCPGEYEISVVDDEYGYEATEVVEITEPDLLVITFDPEEGVSCSSGDDGTITISVDGGVEDYVFNWGAGIEGEEFVEGLDVGTYSVVVTDANKCQALLADIEVPRCETGECFIGSPVITPNADGFNDYFVISCLRDIPASELVVYDRWGREVYSVENYDGTWDGTGTDGELDEGSYMWVLTAFLNNGDERQYKGTLTILR
jgi:gliding motility-associated-like protein